MTSEAIFEDVEGTFIGIDLGTSNSVVTYFKNNNFEQVKFRNKKIIPSVLYYESKDKVIFGDKALKKGVGSPEFMIKEFKRDLGSKVKYTISFPSEEKEEVEGGVFIIDTNIFIDEPFVLKQFSKNDDVKLSKTVVSELSNLEKNKDVKESAAMALESINEYKLERNIALEDSCLDLLSEDLTSNSRNDDNDNRILSIAKNFTNEVSNKRVYLLTNDKGLTSKAEGEKVAVVNYSEFNHDKSQKTSENSDQEIHVTPKEASKKLLSYIKEVSEVSLGEDIQKAVITVPANFNPAQIALVKEAGEEAGFDEVAIQKEPVAVGFAYAMDEEGDKTILVYDFGGGTFDVSFLKIENGNIEVVETDGDNSLGGKDITNKLREFIFDKILDENDELDMFDKASSNLSQKDYDMNLSKISNEAERVKIELSEYDEVMLSISNLMGAGDSVFNLEFEISRKEFENEIADIRKKSMDIVKNLIERSGIDRSDIDEIVMAGGSSSIPSIRESLKDQLGIKPKKSIDTSVVISQGATVEAIRRFSDMKSIQDKIVYNDTALHDFGIGIKDLNFDLIIPKGSSLPIKGIKDYTNQKDNQETIEIKVFQRKSTYPDVKKTHDKGIDLVDEIIIGGIPPSKVNELTIRVAFELTKDDSLSVSVSILDKNDTEIHSDHLNISKASDV
ncbi:MAG: Hsp70 family protein [Gammaproteobacteria bacterium]|nr:Hsp70 family protein [Gammaproteobacteria bacterium]